MAAAEWTHDPVARLDRQAGIGMLRRDGGWQHKTHRGILLMRNDSRARMFLDCLQSSGPVTPPSIQHRADGPCPIG